MNTGRIGRADRRPVRRLPEESIIEAINREDQVPVAHFIKVDAKDPLSPERSKRTKEKERFKSAYLEPYDSTNSETEELDNENSWFEELEDDESDTNLYAFPIERTTRNSTQGRQERFDNVFPPAQNKGLKRPSEQQGGRENAPKSKVLEITPTAPKETRSEARVKGKARDKGWDSNNIVMDDVEEGKQEEGKKAKENMHKSNSNPNRKNPTCQRVSDLAAKIKLEKIIESVLKTPIRLEVGELLGTSCELSGILANTIKPKFLGTDPKIEAHSVWTKT
ncbi:hypothetical protein F4604DRAFT_1928058 [Suillus subluteus]|nr:hypothetical protein F4604DRAFT_1928058 [Suillus subluteus]